MLASLMEAMVWERVALVELRSANLAFAAVPETL